MTTNHPKWPNILIGVVLTAFLAVMLAVMAWERLGPVWRRDREEPEMFRLIDAPWEHNNEQGTTAQRL